MRSAISLFIIFSLSIIAGLFYYVLPIDYDDFKWRDWVFLVGSAVGVVLGLFNLFEHVVGDIFRRKEADFDHQIRDPIEVILSDVQDAIVDLKLIMDGGVSEKNWQKRLREFQLEKLLRVFRKLDIRLRGFPSKYENFGFDCRDIVDIHRDKILGHFNFLFQQEFSIEVICENLTQVESQTVELVRQLTNKIERRRP